MKKILLASMVGAVALLAGCEIEVLDPSCEIKALGSTAMCVTSENKSYIHEACEDAQKGYPLSDGYEDYGCAGGAKQVCSGYDNGTYFTVNFYYETRLSCDEVLQDFLDGEDEYGFDEDDPYYMKALKFTQKKLEAKK
ncbi:MAG: hypothetical protein IK012_09470 [Fibrobacter sp.]|uniref:hypothetical protein n=1 Tax=Fibrobacter sp. TaxID=35828 RepID=UPI0025C22AC6|nr:hypothetical protein [Fibrobacter sp.]MBR4785462.1 hypothetical protein [Fibrobacter sp.]